MGKLNLFSGINEECEVIEASGKLKDLLPSILPDLDLNKVIILKEGKRLDLNYEVTEEDILYIRKAPGGLDPVSWILIGVFSAYALGLAVTAVAGQVKADAQQRLDKAQQEAKELSAKNIQYPFLKGANNKTALGSTIPYIIGCMYHTPYLLTSGFYSISGEDGKNQYWNCALVSGYNNQLIESVSVGSNSILKGDTAIQTDEGSSFNYISEGIHNFDSNSIYYDSDNKIEVRNSGELTLSGLNQKVTCTSYGDSINHDWNASESEVEPIIKQLESNTMAVDIGICFNGLRYYSDGWKAKKCQLKFEWSNNASSDNPTWNLIQNWEIEKNTNHTIRFEIKKTFTASESYGKDISIRITRMNPEEESNSNETAYLIYTNCWAYDAKKSTASSLVPCALIENPFRDKTTRIGCKIIANDSTKDSLNEINIITHGLAPIYQNGSWSENKYPTRNNASWILEVLESEAHSHSIVDRDEIDTDSLGAVYNHCITKGFHADGIITEAKKKTDILNSLLAECDSSALLVTSSGLIEFFIDKKENYPIALLNAQSVKDITVAKSFERKASAQKVSFINRSAWAVDNAYMSLDGVVNSEAIYDENLTVQENSLSFVTEFNHAYKLVHKALASQSLQPREITASVGREGDYYPLYSLVMLQLKELKVGLSNGVIKGFLMNESQIIGIKLSDSVDLSDTSKRYGVIIQANNANGKEYLYIECFGNGDKEILFSNSVVYTIAPEVGNIYSIGELDSNGQFTTVTNLMKIYETNRKNEGYELKLKDYNEAIYEEGEIPAFKSNLTITPKTGSEIKAPTYGDLTSVAEEFSNITLAKVNKLFNTQLVQIYKESNARVSGVDLPTSKLIYNFEEGSYNWENPDSGYPEKSNGWTWTYPGEAEATVYTSYATAQSQEKTASIDSDDWSEPIPSGHNGTSGMNLYTITLYTRENDAPSYLPSTLTFNFRSGDLSGSKNGWSTSIPSANGNDNPVWEIHALASSENETATITQDKWSEAVRISSDGISEDRVKEIVQEELSDVVETPNVFADFTHAGFAVNSEKKVTKAQEVNITIHVVQTNEELDFTIDETRLSSLLPSGWSYSINYHTITLRVNSGVKITTGSFVIPIIYRSFKYNNNLGYKIDNEDNTLGYGEEDLETYLGYKVYYDNDSNYDLGFTFEGIEGGLYLGTISSVTDIPSSGLTIGDYFTFTGANTASELSQDGSFKQCAVYFYSGEGNSYKWEKDNNEAHIMGVIKDIISVANADLENNNSSAYEYLQHLTANSIFVDKLIGNEAFISRLLTESLVVGKFTSTKEEAESYADGLSDEIIEALSADESQTIIEGGKIKTSLIETDELLADYVKADEIHASIIEGDKVKFNSIDIEGDSTFKGELNGATGSFTGALTASSLTLSEDCQVGTNLLLKRNGAIECSDIKSTGMLYSSGISINRYSFKKENQSYYNIYEDFPTIFEIFGGLKTITGKPAIEFNALVTGILHITRDRIDAEVGHEAIFYYINVTDVYYYKSLSTSYLQKLIIRGVYNNYLPIEINIVNNPRFSSRVINLNIYDDFDNISRSYEITSQYDAKISGFVIF